MRFLDGEGGMKREGSGLIGSTGRSVFVASFANERLNVFTSERVGAIPVVTNLDSFSIDHFQLIVISCSHAEPLDTLPRLQIVDSMGTMLVLYCNLAYHTRPSIPITLPEAPGPST